MRTFKVWFMNREGREDYYVICAKDENEAIGLGWFSFMTVIEVEEIVEDEEWMYDR